MSGKVPGKASLRQPQPGRVPEHEEYGRETKGMSECPVCHNIHFRKQWYATRAQVFAMVQIRDGGFVIRERLCPACTMVRDHLFEGELIIERVPETLRGDLVRLIDRYGKQATEQDPQDRIIEVKVAGDGYRVTTTENQLADRLAKKIRDAFKKVEVHFSHSREPFEVDRIRVVFEGGV